jgi:hypothetical protein
MDHYSDGLLFQLPLESLACDEKRPILETTVSYEFSAWFVTMRRILGSQSHSLADFICSIYKEGADMQAEGMDWQLIAFFRNETSSTMAAVNRSSGD